MNKVRLRGLIARKLIEPAVHVLRLKSRLQERSPPARTKDGQLIEPA